MKRNWDIIRTVLLALEDAGTPNASVSMTSFPDLDPQEVAYNIRLLHDADCVEAKILNSSTGDRLIHAAIADRLTDKGHDLFDTIRNASVWERIKERFASKGVDMTVDLAISEGKRMLEQLLT